MCPHHAKLLDIQSAAYVGIVSSSQDAAAITHVTLGKTVVMILASYVLVSYTNAF